MSKYSKVKKPKFKLCKRLGSGIYEKCQTQKYAVSEARARKQQRRPRVLSDYGRQLLEKQKVRFAYGISEKQMKRYVTESLKAQDTINALYSRLELRLDNVVYKMGLAPTRRAARQMVSHGHITVNGKKMTIPSHKVSVGDVVAVRENSKARALFAHVAERLKKHKAENWLSLDPAKMSAEIKSEPNFDPAQSVFDLASVFEFYTR